MHQEGKRYIFGFVKVGKKGQIVLPKEARTVFGIAPGDSLMLVGNEESGLSILTNERLSTMLGAVLGAPPLPTSAEGTAEEKEK